MSGSSVVAASTPRRSALTFGLGLAVLLAASIALSLLIGPLPLAELDEALTRLRLTRAGAAALSGACLAVAGVLMQGLFRNPLAGPSITGVSEGAALGVQMAVAAVVFAPAALAAVPGEFARPLAGFIGASVALALLLALTRRRSDLTSVLLIGMVLSMLFSAVAAYLLALGGDRYELGRAMVAFALGALDAASPAQVLVSVPLALIAIAAAWWWGRPLDTALAGEAEARSLGVDVAQLRRWALAWTALLAATAVALGGGVAFVGLVVPNLLRAWIGPEHRTLVWTSALGGAVFLVLADIAARVCNPGPGEVPLGAITGLIGAPFFLWFFRRERQAGRL